MDSIHIKIGKTDKSSLLLDLAAIKNNNGPEKGRRLCFMLFFDRPHLFLPPISVKQLENRISESNMALGTRKRKQIVSNKCPPAAPSRAHISIVLWFFPVGASCS